MVQPDAKQAREEKKQLIFKSFHKPLKKGKKNNGKERAHSLEWNLVWYYLFPHPYLKN